MNHFELRNGELFCEDVPLARIAEAAGTPVYVYSSATLARHFTVMREALREAGLGEPLIAFAVKANSNVAVLRTLAGLGAGADVVSEGEIRRALAAGVPPERIVFSGVGKTAEEIAFALQTGVAEINVESEPEMRLIDQVVPVTTAAVLDVGAGASSLVDALLGRGFTDLTVLDLSHALAGPLASTVVIEGAATPPNGPEPRSGRYRR